MKSGSGASIYGLKAAAKWSQNQEEKKRAVTKLQAFGKEAIPALQEIFNVTAYKDVKESCAEAIKEIRRNERSITPKNPKGRRSKGRERHKKARRKATARLKRK